MASPYKIGSTFGGMASIDTLFGDSRDKEPRGMPMDYTVIRELGNGSIRRGGRLDQIWHWDRMTETMRNSLFAFSGLTVYVQTRKNDGTFDTFTARVIWPEQEPEHYANRVLGLDVTLRGLVSYEEV